MPEVLVSFALTVPAQPRPRRFDLLRRFVRNENAEPARLSWSLGTRLIPARLLVFILREAKRTSGHREEIYREGTLGKLCHADIFSLLAIENDINSLFY
jgi:hypothetical protein